MEIKRGRIIFTILIIVTALILIPTTFANEQLELGIEKINKGEYYNTTLILEEICPTLESNEFNNDFWKCNFYLGFAYENTEFKKIVTDKFTVSRVSSRSLESAKEYYKKAITNSNLKLGTPIISDSFIPALTEKLYLIGSVKFFFSEEGM